MELRCPTMIQAMPIGCSGVPAPATESANTKSRNFEFLRPKRGVLADLAGFAERYAHEDPGWAGCQAKGGLRTIRHRDARCHSEA